jgi:hypothetical protein
MTEESILSQDKRLCQCGCGVMIKRLDSRNRPSFYKNGHCKGKGVTNPELRVCYCCGTQELKLSWTANIDINGKILQYLCFDCWYWLTRRHKSKHSKCHVCYACGGTVSRIWYWNYDREDNSLCNQCFVRLYLREYHREHSRKRKEFWGPRRVSFKGKRVQLNFIPRKGVCEWCHKTISRGEIKTTHIHHIEYDPTDPMAHTVEVCQSCHTTFHKMYERVMLYVFFALVIYFLSKFA